MALGELCLREKDWAGLNDFIKKLRPLGPMGEVESARLDAQARMEHGDYAAARWLLAAALEKHPGAVPLLIVMSHVWLREGGREREAEAALRAVLALVPEHLETKRNLEILTKE